LLDQGHDGGGQVLIITWKLGSLITWITQLDADGHGMRQIMILISEASDMAGAP